MCGGGRGQHYIVFHINFIFKKVSFKFLIELNNIFQVKLSIKGHLRKWIEIILTKDQSLTFLSFGYKSTIFKNESSCTKIHYVIF